MLNRTTINYLRNFDKNISKILFFYNILWVTYFKALFNEFSINSVSN